MGRAPASPRRRFLHISGAAVSALLGTRAEGSAIGKPAAETTAGDVAAILQLYQGYATCIAASAVDQVAALFTADAVDSVSTAIPRRLLLDPAQSQECIEVAANGQSAVARFGCFVQRAEPLEGDAPLLAMARLQGIDAEVWWESGVHELECVKAGGAWKIHRLTYRGAGRLDWQT